MIENKTIYNEELVKKAVSITARKVVLIYVLCGILITGFAVFNFIFSSGNNRKIVLVLAVCFLGMLIYNAVKRIKVTRARFLAQIRESHGAEEYECRMQFDDEKVTAITSNSRKEMYYNDVHSMPESKDVMLLISRTHAFMIVDKSGFSHGSSAELKERIQPFIDRNKKRK